MNAQYQWMNAHINAPLHSTTYSHTLHIYTLHIYTHSPHLHYTHINSQAKNNSAVNVRVWYNESVLFVRAVAGLARLVPGFGVWRGGVAVRARLAGGGSDDEPGFLSLGEYYCELLYMLYKLYKLY